jgi:hypothetical protein
MALIERHPEVSDYFVNMPLAEIRERGGIADLFEEGRLIVIADYRLDVDFEALAALSKSTDGIADPELRRKLKKLTSPYFFKGPAPEEIGDRLVQIDAKFRELSYPLQPRLEVDTINATNESQIVRAGKSPMKPA